MILFAFLRSVGAMDFWPSIYPPSKPRWPRGNLKSNRRSWRITYGACILDESCRTVIPTSEHGVCENPSQGALTIYCTLTGHMWVNNGLHCGCGMRAADLCFWGRCRVAGFTCHFRELRFLILICLIGGYFRHGRDGGGTHGIQYAVLGDET
jgi:hypothetical protein